MENLDFKNEIDRIWEDGGSCDPKILEIIFSALYQGLLRVAQKSPDGWFVNTWIKKAILLYFKQTKATFRQRMQHPLLIKFLSSAWDGQPLILKKTRISYCSRRNCSSWNFFGASSRCDAQLY